MWPNLITNEPYLHDGVVSLYKWDKTLFDNLVLPQTVDKNLFINTLFHRCGEAPLQHPDPEYMKFFIGVWSRRNLDIWNKLEATMNLEYNPIHNYDRTEEIEETGKSNRDTSVSNDNTVIRDTTSSGTDSRDGTSHQDSNTKVTQSSDISGNIENTVSAENSDIYQPDTNQSDVQHNQGQSTTDIVTNGDTTDSGRYSNTGKSTETGDFTGKTDDDETHEEHRYLRAYGNVGVTTTQEMISAQREIVQFNLCDFIVESFHAEFCLYVY